MQRISITNPQNIIDGTAKKYYFKLRNTGGPKGDKGDKGDTGATGPQGPQGNAATVSVGSTTTLPVGYDATVTNTGSIYNAVLDFGIPQGPQGPQGAKGDKGDTGAKGDTGPRGPQGERGTNATVYVGTTTTTNPGTQARVYNSGTDSNAVLNFEIPRGDVGPMPTIAQTTGQSTTEVMSQKATTDALNNGLATKQNTLTAGNNITISGNTISAKDTTYTAGNNVQINGTTISATDTKYTNGNGLNLNGTEFSADTDVLATKEDLEGYYTKPETDNLLAPKLEAEVVAELPTTGEGGKLYLTPKAHTTQTATGNPITATITEEAGKIESFQLDGDTFQQTYIGKNLYEWEDADFSSSTTSSSWCFQDGATGAYGANITSKTTYKLTLPSGAYYLSAYNVSSNIERINLCTDGDSAERVLASPDGSFYLSEERVVVIRYRVTNPSLGIGNTKIQLEAGSTATSYEPYVGGTPSPNPDYPQPIQTVTGEQTVTVVGKNKYPFNDTAWSTTQTASQWCFPNGATNAYGATITGKTAYKFTLPAGTYTMTAFGLSSNIINIQACTNGESAETIVTSPANINSENLSSTITLAETTTLCVRYRVTNPSLGIGNTKIQIEASSTASDYAPYFKQTLPLDLGSIELCKLGTYQDYIYKDGDSWKVHKDTGKYTFKGTEQWGSTGAGNHSCYSTAITGYATSDNVPYSPYFSGISNVNGAGVMNTKPDNSIAFIDQSATVRFYIKSSKFENDALVLKTWLSTHNTDVYYALATATDTIITDQTLIAQLEAIRTASLENGANTITNTATGSNLAGDTEIGYYGYNPTNRYDKWLWLDINNEYEQLNNPDTSSTLSTLSTRTLGTTTEQPTVTRSLETETITLKKGETEPIEDKTGLPTIQDEETEEAETTEPEESDGTDER